MVLRPNPCALSYPHALLRPRAYWFVFLLLSFGSLCCGTNTVSLGTSTLAITGSNPNYSANVGTINGLGLGTPASNVNTMSYAGGELYYFDFHITVGFNGGSGTLSVQTSTNYTHSAVQAAYMCVSGECNTVTPTAITTSYTAILTGLASGSYTATIGTLLQPTNGAAAFTGSDSVTVTFEVAGSFGSPHTCNLTINLTAQNAVQFTLATSGAGLSISPAADFSAAWGTVNGLGVGTPSSGLTVYSVSGGAVYETPISLLPIYSSFSATTCTLSVYVSSNFTHSSLFFLKDTGTSGGPYTTISLSSGSPTSMTTTAASSSTITRYLGVFVSNLDGASAYRGSDNATLTYQMTVP